VAPSPSPTGEAGGLPVTGVAVTGIILAGVVLLGAGIALAVISRRRSVKQ
jgi:LPXTG-motif cell wall-anchored protein